MLYPALELVEEHKREKARLIEEEKKLHFSYEEHQNLNDTERAADEKLTQLKNKLATPIHNVVLHDFYDMKPEIEKTQLHQILIDMPKGALHHIHTSASPYVEQFIKLTYDPVVAYNEREGMFKVLLGHEKLDGYVPCVEVRNFYKNPNDYDDILRQQILLTEVEARHTESHDIWKAF